MAARLSEKHADAKHPKKRGKAELQAELVVIMDEFLISALRHRLRSASVLRLVSLVIRVMAPTLAERSRDHPAGSLTSDGKPILTLPVFYGMVVSHSLFSSSLLSTISNQSVSDVDPHAAAADNGKIALVGLLEAILALVLDYAVPAPVSSVKDPSRKRKVFDEPTAATAVIIDPELKVLTPEECAVVFNKRLLSLLLALYQGTLSPLDRRIKGTIGLCARSPYPPPPSASC